MTCENNDMKTIKIFQTVRDADDRLTKKEDMVFAEDKTGIENSVINIYEDISYQEIEGFGGAFTEAASTTIDKLSSDKRKEIINAYFNPEKGIGYTLCRTHINSCDFSIGNYAYDEAEGDTGLKHFNIDRDKKSLIPFIKEAAEVENAGFKLFASPWSPPAWMKTNGEMNHGGQLKKEYHEVWARYFAKYIKGYADEGINIWGVTVQNEAKATQKWDSCVYSAEQERDFVKYYLGPVLEKEGLSNVKIMIWDHNKERVYDRAKVAFSDAEASKYIWGTAFHWYSGDHFEALSVLHDKFPDKKLLFTEGCREGGKKFGAWDKGETYGHDIIGDLNNWAAGWTDWNMVLNEIGGPNHVGNYCDAPVIADTKTGTVHYGSQYFYIGHFSKFIRPGAKRIGFSRFTEQLEVTAFKNVNGEISVIVMNRSDKDISFTLRTHYGIAQLLSRSHSIMTLIY